MSVRRTQRSSRPIYITSIPREKVTSVLRVDQALRGTVIEELADNLYIINFRGFNLTSRTPSKFKRGRRIFVRVTEIGEQILMRLLPDDEYEEAEREANEDGLDLRLEEIGIAPSRLNRLIACEMLRRGMPLTSESLEEALSDVARLDIEDEEEIRALVYLSSMGYPRTRSSVRLATFLDFPEGSKLLGTLMNMTEREPAGGEGPPVRIFDDAGRSGFCFRYAGANVGDTKAIGVVEGDSARIELLVENESVKRRFELNGLKLEKRLGADGVVLEDLALIVEKVVEENGRVVLGTPLGIDFRA